MSNWGKALAVAGVMAVTAIVGGGAGNAAPLGATIDRPATAGSLVEPVHGYSRPRVLYDNYEQLPQHVPYPGTYRRSYHSRDHSGYYAPYYAPHYGTYYAPPVVHYESRSSVNRRLRIGHPHDMARCASVFRSFNPYTGMYVTYDGEVRPCPFID